MLAGVCSACIKGRGCSDDVQGRRGCEQQGRVGSGGVAGRGPSWPCLGRESAAVFPGLCWNDVLRSVDGICW